VQDLIVHVADAQIRAAGVGRTLPAYDNLEFKIVNGEIVCEGVVVDPPKLARDR
jgi:hypothetical protein